MTLTDKSSLIGGFMPPRGPIGSGSGAAGEVAFLNSDLELAFDSGFSYDAAANKLTIPGDIVIDNAASPSLTLTEDGGTDYLRLTNTSGTRSTIEHVSSSGIAQIDIDPKPSDGSSAAKFRFFRITNTLGLVSFQIFKGDGSDTVNHLFAGNSSSYMCRDNSTFKIGATGAVTGGIFEVVGKSIFDDAIFSSDLEIDGAFNHDGLTVGVYGVAPVVRGSGWTVSNDSTDRVLNASVQNLSQLYDVVATLIRDVAAPGFIGAVS